MYNISYISDIAEGTQQINTSAGHHLVALERLEFEWRLVHYTYVLGE